MKKIILFTIAIVSVVSMAWAAKTIWIHQNDNITLGMPLASAEMITLSDDGATVNFALKNNAGNHSINYTEIEKVTIGESQEVITINYNGTDAEIVNPYAFQGVTITKTGGDVVVNSTSTSELTYQLTGTASSGSFKIYSDTKFVLNLNSVNITNNDGAAINIQTGKKCTVNLSGSSALCDAASYTTVTGEDQKGCFFSEGQIIFTGSGSLDVTGNYKHGICSDDYIDIQSGTVNIVKAANDGIRVNDYFLMTNGTLNTANTTGDGIDGDTGYIQIDNGTINVNIATADTKGIKCDSIITMNGGNVTLTVPAAQGKGFKTKQTMTMNGGKITANMTGAVAVVSYDPSYCTAIKTDIDFVMTGGDIIVTHSGEAGKGISADGNITFKGGNVKITTTGNGNTYTASTGTDTYCSTCISTDGNLYLDGGNLTLSASGTGGKCIKADLQLIAKPASDNDLTVIAETKGTQVGNSSSGGPGGGGRPGRPGSSSSTSDTSTSPKVIKSTGNMTISGGNFTIKSASEGGEGLESKATMTISGGNFYFNTYDDCINAASALVISGGNIRAVATGNDAIDSNGSMTISGGVTLASGTRDPEEGLDVDQASKLSITGGTLINQKGNMLNLTTTQCKVPTVKYSSSISAGTLVTITDASGNHIVSFKAPQAMSQGCYITHPSLKSGNSYKLYTGGSVSGGKAFNEVTNEGTYTAGTLVKTFSISSNLTTL